MSTTQDESNFYGSMQVNAATALEAVTMGWYSRKDLVIQLVGDPGSAKTEIGSAAAANLTEMLKVPFEFRSKELSLIEPSDLIGLPIVRDVELETPEGTKTVKQSSYAVPDFLPTHGNGVLLLDEFSAATSEVQRASMNFLLTRKIGDYKLPEGWSIMLASNIGDDYDTNDMTDPAVISRIQTIQVKITAPEWLTWYKPHPDANQCVASFISSKPNMLYDKESMTEQRAFANPRTWFRIGRFINTQLERGVDMTSAPVLAIMAGYIGKTNASIFAEYLSKNLKLVDLNKVLFAYPSVKKQVQSLNTTESLSILMDLISSVAVGIIEHGNNPDDIDLIVPNVSEFLEDLNDEKVMTWAQEFGAYNSDPKTAKIVKSFNRKMCGYRPSLSKKIVSLSTKLNSSDY